MEKTGPFVIRDSSGLSEPESPYVQAYNLAIFPLILLTILNLSFLNTCEVGLHRYT